MRWHYLRLLLLSVYLKVSFAFILPIATYLYRKRTQIHANGEQYKVSTSSREVII
jgi:hypothetical protein